MTIQVIEEQIQYWLKMKELLLAIIPNDASLDTIIYKKYLEMENVANVARWLNEQGYRTKSESTGNEIKFNSNDITDRINDKSADVQEDLKIYVKKLFKNHKLYANKRYN